MAKENIRYIRHSLLFNKVYKLFLIHLVLQAIKILNRFPVKGGIYATNDPTTIMTGDILHYKKHIGVHIGQYFQVHEEDTPYNSNQSRTKGSTCMGTSVNIQGGFKFMILRSMKNITRQYWYIILMPDTVIDRVNLLRKYQKELLVFIGC